MMQRFINLVMIVFVVATNVTASLINTTLVVLPSSPYAVDCNLRLVNPQFRQELTEMLNEGVKLIDYDINIKDYYDSVLERKGGNIYKWNHWMRTVDNYGRSLLMLEENYDLMSLNSMKIGVEQLNVSLYDEPSGCLGALTSRDTLDLIRRTLLNDFKNITSPQPNPNSKEPSDHVCNMYIKDNNGYAVFLYTCCHYIENEMVCEDVNRDLWMNFLMGFLSAVKILLVLFSPLLIPERLYRVKFTDSEYHYHLPEELPPQTIRVVTTRDPRTYQSKNKVVKLNEIQGMPYFKTMLDNMHLDNVYEVQLDDLRISVSSHRLLKENTVPVSIFSYFYDHMCRCKIRNSKPFFDCCHSDVFGSFGFKVYPWYKCLRPFTKFVQIGVFILPWVIRFVIFTLYEQKNVNYKQLLAHNMNLKTHFTGSFTIYLTPIHGLFIVCYIVLCFDAIVYGVISKAVKDKFKRVTVTSLRAMRENSKQEVCSVLVNMILTPFTSFGIVGIVLAVPYWLILSPIFVALCLFYFIPTINFVVRMVIHFLLFVCPESISSKLKTLMKKTQIFNKRLRLNKLNEEGNFDEKGSLSKRELLMQYVVILICIISFISLTFLVMECVSFFVEILLYTTIGIIINAHIALKYISVISLFILYARDCFGKLHKKYLSFHKIIAKQLLAKEKALILKTVRSDEGVQQNTVFKVESDEGKTEKEISIIVKCGVIRWSTSGLLVLLNNEDRPFFTKKFFQQVINMKYQGCPGPLHISIFRTFVQFSKIIMFIIFMAIVVMAFGDVYHISPMNQLIATGAGGLLPFVITHFFTKKGERIFDVESVQFKAEFNQAIDEFKQTWPVYDIVPKQFREISSDFCIINDETIDQNNCNDNNETSPIVVNNIQSLDYIDNNNADLIVDVSTFSDRDRSMLNDMALSGSLTMLSERYDESDKNKITTNNNIYTV